MTTLADEMKAHALEAQRYSRKHFVLELDFSEASVKELENQADSVTYAMRGGKTPENIALLSRLWGAYLGEALRKLTGAEWFEESVAELRRIGLRKGSNSPIHPHEQVHHRLLGRADSNLLTYFQQVRDQMKS